MINERLFRQLVPNAPKHRRTEADLFSYPQASGRMLAASIFKHMTAAAGGAFSSPQLISSYNGSIERLLFCFPNYGVSNRDLNRAYQSLISELRAGTEFVVLHHESDLAAVESWFQTAGHLGNTLFVPVPDFVNFTDWAEDAYVALVDQATNDTVLMEPWEFPRSGDSLIAEAVQSNSQILASQAPLIFQGGNCLIGDTFWFLGRDYFADTMALFSQRRGPISVPSGMSVDQMVKASFAQYLDNNRNLILIGPRQPISALPIRGTREGTDFFLDIIGSGVGTFQPIFHIDMFITLIGQGENNRFRVMVGDPGLADRLLGTTSPHSLESVYNSIARDLDQAGFDVIRNPLVHRPVLGSSYTLRDLISIAAKPGNEDLLDPIAELQALGAVQTDNIAVRSWHHITWNNCLVESSDSNGRHVYLPTYGHGANIDLQPIDDFVKDLWQAEGFTAHMLGDFNPFAERQGVVHCIKKYLARGA